MAPAASHAAALPDAEPRPSEPRQQAGSARRRPPAHSAGAVTVLALLAVAAFITAPAHALSADTRPSARAGGGGAAGLGPGVGLDRAAAPGAAALPEAAAPLRHGYHYQGRVRFVDAARGGVPVLELGSAAAAAPGARAGVPQHNTVLVTSEGHRFTKRCAAKAPRCADAKPATWPACCTTALCLGACERCSTELARLPRSLPQPGICECAGSTRVGLWRLQVADGPQRPGAGGGAAGCGLQRRAPGSCGAAERAAAETPRAATDAGPPSAVAVGAWPVQGQRVGQLADVASASLALA